MTQERRLDTQADLRPIQGQDWNERWQKQIAAEPHPAGSNIEGGSNSLLELAEALKPFGFRWPEPKASPAAARSTSAESLFLKAGETPAAYRHWQLNTRFNLRLSRLFLLMRQGWSNEAIEDAITETALATWWLSGKWSDWCIDTVHHKVTPAFAAFLKTPHAEIEAQWRARQQTAPRSGPAASTQPKPPSHEVLSSGEVIAQLPEHSITAFRKQMIRAAGKFRGNGQKAPVPLGGAGKGWALVKLGKGGHGGGHLLQRLNPRP